MKSFVVASSSRFPCTGHWESYRIDFHVLVSIQGLKSGSIIQHVPTSIRTKNTTTREQPPRMCKNSISKMKSDSAIGQHLITNPECAKTYTDDNFRIIGQARSSFHLGVLESVYIKTQNPVLCKQKEFVFSLGLFK